MKTGTTSIQAALDANPDLLAEHQLKYLGWPMRHPRLMQRAMAKGSPELGPIISDEGLWHHCASERSPTRKIAELFEGYDQTVIVYFRRPSEYVESWFLQGLKRGTGQQTLDEFMAARHVNRPDVPGVNLRVLGKLDFITRTFPHARIVVRPFETSQMVGGDAVHDFFNVLGFPAPEVSGDEEAARENVSPDPTDLLLVNLLRRRLGAPEEVLAELLALPARAGRRRFLTYAEATSINEAMRPVFREVQERWGGGSTPDFFENWDIDEASYTVSPVRAFYDSAVVGRRFRRSRRS